MAKETGAADIVRDQAVLEHVTAMLARDRASIALGVRLEEAGPGRGVVTMTVGEEMTNAHGMCHGGLIATLADTAFAVACNSHGPMTVASGFSVTFLEPVRTGDRLVARAVEVQRRGRSGVYDVTVSRRVEDAAGGAEEQVVALLRGQSRTVRQR